MNIMEDRVNELEIKLAKLESYNDLISRFDDFEDKLNQMR